MIKNTMKAVRMIPGLAAVVLAGLGYLSLSPVATAQSARVIVTVKQQTIARSSSAAAGALVCFTSTDNTKITDEQGVVTFSDVPIGAWSAVAWKSGYKANRGDVAVTSKTGDYRVTITLKSGSERSPCIAPPPAPPPPSPNVELTVKVIRTDGSAIQNARVCVGTMGGPDLYGLAQQTGSSGKVYFTVPRMYSIYVTASASGFAGVGKTVYLPVSDSEGYTEVTLVAGTGGNECPVYE